jgi:hypothetical protein
MKIEISNGELIDKLSILEIKSKNIKDESKLNNINKEFFELKDIASELLKIDGVYELYQELIEVNNTLWDIEDSIRWKEREKKFDEEFVYYARNVYITNDLRFKLKSKINELTDSYFVEEKSYERY